ncbi:von Willebrand factor type A domain-containing protein [Verrucomicrobiaceae bacterium 5K15]|uniref:von Willebrand factor type A domain-containing protein n=1 Tax=Oceaniferula flava TaxID=2800421 RepID=A0AAE2SAW9_9BACT|nr:von Willebrand factor type A domain-containing protein [Oceaniferula flavus]MBK1853607.1 von Willebrand factor type A domain-containing protein [Oceaniferula flavus]MBM1134912.1 von Willebrand factor type A domain-containing protein [Oceaniferula flavus]
MKKEDQMIDALLNEHARKGSGDDVEFLTDLEARLDAEKNVTSMPTSSSSNKGRGPAIGVGIAAALTIAAVGYYGWKSDRDRDLAVNDSQAATEQLQEAPVSYSAPPEPKPSLLPAAEQKKAKDTLGVAKAEGRIRAARIAEVESTMAEDAAPVPQAAPVQPRVLKPRPMTRKPSAPSSSMAKMRGQGAAGGAGAYRLDLPSKAREIGNSDAFGDGWGSERRRDHFHGRPAKAPGNRYGKLVDNSFLSPWKAPLSTFSVDVDTASYTNMRRMIQSGQSVPKDAVRIEEMINYFSYDYPQPVGKHPFSVNVETASCPWNEEHRLVKIGLQGKDIIREKRPAANLVFLLDVSGSMNAQDKLPLLVDSMKILLKELNGDDSVSIVVYAGAQGLALPPTYVDEDGRKTILKKLNNFRSGGSTNGGAGITLAYKMAKKHFVKGGVNRVILGTDGDFNVGLTDRSKLVSMVEREAKSGVYLSVLGFGQGNLNDAMLEAITNKGNGNYSYIDSLREGRKVFLDDMMGNMVTIAKDVKIQVEFNPAKVKSYRLIGYANRMLKAEDFKNKLIDAGEIGAGHTVTALYEIVPGNAAESAPVVDDLEYQKSKKPAPKPADRAVVDSPNLLTVKLAYKGPEASKETESTYFRTRVIDGGKSWKDASDDFKFASGVSLFGMLQRGSEHAGQGSYQLVRKLAEQGRGKDEKGHRTEFSDLVRKVK